MVKSVRRLTRTKTALSLAIIAAGMGMGPLAASAPAFAAAKAGGTVITTREGPFGTMLVVGSGKFAGYTLYLFTGDSPGAYACTATIVKSLPGGPGSCSGTSSDKTAEWPAITTTGAPVAGAGVSQKLLGSVVRPGIGDQVTYAGHPLYLFDQGPGQVTGEGWDEPSLPPWHGLWWLVSPSGTPLAWPDDADDHRHRRQDRPGRHHVHRHRLGGVPRLLLHPGHGHHQQVHRRLRHRLASPADQQQAGRGGQLTAASVGTIKRSNGTDQVTYGGKPLYMFAYEGIAPQGVGYVATGSGNGAKVGGGVFDLVTP